jgi:hypothetical protein
MHDPYHKDHLYTRAACIGPPMYKEHLYTRTTCILGPPVYKGHLYRATCVQGPPVYKEHLSTSNTSIDPLRGLSKNSIPITNKIMLQERQPMCR